MPREGLSFARSGCNTHLRLKTAAEIHALSARVMSAALFTRLGSALDKQTGMENEAFVDLCARFRGAGRHVRDGGPVLSISALHTIAQRRRATLSVLYTPRNGPISLRIRIRVLPRCLS